MASKEYSVRKVEQVKAKQHFDNLDYTPLAIPIGGFQDTTTQAIERIMLASGAITREQWDRLKGFEYDVDTEGYPLDDFAEVDDEFEQSPLASYQEQEVKELLADEAKQNLGDTDKKEVSQVKPEGHAPEGATVDEVQDEK